MTASEIRAEINRLLDMCCMRQLELVLRMVQVILGEGAQA